MAWNGISENGKTVLLAAITTLGALGTLWIQSHNQHADKMAVESAKVEAIKEQTKMIQAALDRKPLVFGERPN